MKLVAQTNPSDAMHLAHKHPVVTMAHASHDSMAPVRALKAAELPAGANQGAARRRMRHQELEGLLCETCSVELNDVTAGACLGCCRRVKWMMEVSAKSTALAIEAALSGTVSFAGGI